MHKTLVNKANTGSSTYMFEVLFQKNGVPLENNFIKNRKETQKASQLK